MGADFPRMDILFYRNYILFLAPVSCCGGWNGESAEARRSFSRKWRFSHGSAQRRAGSGATSKLSHWSDLAFFGPVPFISGDETGLFAAGLAAEPSLLVS